MAIKKINEAYHKYSQLFLFRNEDFKMEWEEFQTSIPQKKDNEKFQEPFKKTN